MKTTNKQTNSPRFPPDQDTFFTMNHAENIGGAALSHELQKL